MGEVTPRATLEQNIAAYERMQDQLEAEHMGQWVVVHNQQLIDAFDNFQDAADLVIEKVGPGYLLRQVGRPPTRLPALRLCGLAPPPLSTSY
ncbi:MAG: hypothetical protein F4Y03_06695 [Alphaproteobacteria bacterium]|nr:hypothetical protein [Alphaproteobacteria bacterium]